MWLAGVPAFLMHLPRQRTQGSKVADTAGDVLLEGHSSKGTLSPSQLEMEGTFATTFFSVSSVIGSCFNRPAAEC